MTRIVHCPGCKLLLVEPTAGVAIYQCGNCFKVLYAKHAVQSSLQIQDEHLLSRLGSKKSVPPPLYKPRESVASPTRPTKATPTYSPRHKPLYTPRHADAGTPPLLTQDMQKLALDAFPTKLDVEHDSGGASTAWQNGAREEKDEFEFQNQSFDALDVDMYSYREHAPREYEASDYHSTFQDLDNRSYVTSEDNNAASRRMDVYQPDNRYSAHEDNADTPRFSSKTPSLEIPNGYTISTSEQASNSQRQYPPLDFPYVVCQHCSRRLEVPRHLGPCTKPYQKLRCGACQRISRFALPDKQLPTSFASSTTSSSPMSTLAAHHSTPYNSYLREPRANKLDVFTSDHLHGSPSRGSAPASFHHTHPSNVFSEGKGYESAPEFQFNYSAASKESSTSTYHARSESGASSINGGSLPLAPCLHELFGYESPSQFLNKRQLSEKHKPSKTTSKGIKSFLLSKLHLTHHPTNLIINGKAIPEDKVKRAEERAGHIYTGSYWYDYHAGFWGVAGGPCLGIIPPGIEEFNCPMQRNCAGGRTGVMVNGRELHQQDFDVLVKRGLPPTPHAAYSINIDGIVIDLITETQLKCLGKLAPTMEKCGVGSGMYPLSRGS